MIIALKVGKYTKILIKVSLLNTIEVTRKQINLQMNINVTDTHRPPHNPNKVMIITRSSLLVLGDLVGIILPLINIITMTICGKT